MAFDDHPSFGPAKMADASGRAIPDPVIGDNDANERYSQAKLEAIGGRNLPAPQQGASTLDFTDKGDVDNMGLFPNKN